MTFGEIFTQFLVYAFGTFTLWLAIKMSPAIKDPDNNKLVVAGTINVLSFALWFLLQLFPFGLLGLAGFIAQIVLWFFTIHHFMECPWWYSIILFIGWIVLMVVITMAFITILALVLGTAASM